MPCEESNNEIGKKLDKKYSNERQKKNKLD